MDKWKAFILGGLALGTGAWLIPKIEASKLSKKYGFVMFDSATQLTIPATGAWVDVDVSSLVPSTATGVVLFVRCTGVAGWGPNLNFDFRKNGSTDDNYASQTIGQEEYDLVVVGVDSSGIFEACLEPPISPPTPANSLAVYIIGYTDNRITLFKTPSISGDIMPALGVWTTVDADTYADLPDDVTGVILRQYGALASLWLRKNGSTDDWFSTGDAWLTPFREYFVGVDSNHQFQVYHNLGAGGTLHIAGYTRAPITFPTNINPATRIISSNNGDLSGAWYTKTYYQAGIRGVILMSVDMSGSGDGGIIFRKYGSSIEIIPEAGHYDTTCTLNVVPVDSQGQFQYKSFETSPPETWVIGYWTIDNANYC